MIEKLTEEQIANFPHYVDKWVKIGLNTDPCDIDKARDYVKKSYEIAGLPVPLFILGPVANPGEAVVVEQVLHNWLDKEIPYRDEEHLNQLVLEEARKLVEQGAKPENRLSNQIYGCMETWLSYYDFFQTECGIDTSSKLEGLRGLADTCGWWTPLKSVAILQHRAEEIHRDEENRLHNLNGPAVKFRAGFLNADVYCVHGVRVTKKVVDKQFSAADIDAESNAEVRRVMVDIYGVANYLQDTNAELIHEDDFGTLYRKILNDDEPIYVVKVINSTPEPDGSYKDYFLRVDPNAYGGLKTAHQAVASTWRNKDGSFVFPDHRMYDPDIQT